MISDTSVHSSCLVFVNVLDVSNVILSSLFPPPSTFGLTWQPVDYSVIFSCMVTVIIILNYKDDFCLSLPPFWKEMIAWIHLHFHCFFFFVRLSKTCMSWESLSWKETFLVLFPVLMSHVVSCLRSRSSSAFKTHTNLLILSTSFLMEDLQGMTDSTEVVTPSFLVLIPKHLRKWFVKRCFCHPGGGFLFFGSSKSWAQLTRKSEWPRSWFLREKIFAYMASSSFLRW